MIQNENVLIHIKLKELTNKYNKVKSENELYIKEVNIQKQNIKDITSMYETQIKELQIKTLNVNAEFQSIKRKDSYLIQSTSKGSLEKSKFSGNKLNKTQLIKRVSNPIAEDIENKKNQFQNSNQNQVHTVIVNNPDKVEKAENLELTAALADIKYLKDQIEILNADIQDQKKLRKCDVDFYKAEIGKVEDLVVQTKFNMANIAFEKDTDIFKYKNLSRKLKDKLLSYKEKLKICVDKDKGAIVKTQSITK